MRDTRKVEITGFIQDDNRENKTGTVTVRVNQGEVSKKGEIPNTTVDDVVKDLGRKIGYKNVTNLLEFDRDVKRTTERKERREIHEAMFGFSARKRSRSFD